MLALIMTALLAQTPTPSEVLVAEVVRHAEAAQIMRQELRVSYRKTFLLEDVDDEHRPKKKETKEWDVQWDATGGHEKLICKNDKQVKDGEVKESSPDLTLLLGSRFTAAIVDPPDPPEAECDGAPCVVIAFKPKPPDPEHPLPDAKDDTEAVLFHMAGVAYVDVKHHYIVYAKGHLYAPFTIKVVGSIKRVHAEMWYRNHNGIPMLAKSVSEVFYTRFLFDNVIERRTYEYGKPR